MRICLASCGNLPDWEVDDAPLSAALTSLGCEVTVIPWDDPALGEDGLKRDSAPDAILIRTTWDYVPRHAEFVAWCSAAEKVVPLLNPASVVQWNLDKRYLRLLEQDGVRIAPTRWVEGGERVDLEGLLRETGWGSVFVKPCVGASASDTARARSAFPFELRTAQRILNELAMEVGAIVQPYLESVESHGELSWIVVEGVCTHAVRKIPAGGDYRVQDDWGAHDEPYATTDEETKRAEEIVAIAGRRLGLADPLLYARVDMLRDRGGDLVLNELELVEPSLFFRHGPGAAKRLASAFLARAEAARGVLRASDAT